MPLLLPAGQYEPTGQSTVAVASPPLHKNPASHKRVGYTVPVSGHVKPAKHARQSLSCTFVVVLANLPAGHKVGPELPDGQYAPRGQIAPVTLSVGDAIEAPTIQ